MAKLVGNDLDYSLGARIINLGDPLLPQHPATKNYVDSLLAGLAWKDNVRVAAQVNIIVPAPGATIDGVTMVAGDRLILLFQTLAQENGIYIWNGAATPMTRAADSSTNTGVVNTITSVDSGTSGGVTYRLSTAAPITLGTTPLAFATFGTTAPPATTAVAGVASLATQAEVDAGAVTNKIVTPQTLTAAAGRKLKFAGNIGDGSANVFAVTHNLGTLDVKVTVFRNSGAGDEILVDTEHTSVNVITIRFAAVVIPTVNQFRVVVIG